MKHRPYNSPHRFGDRPVNILRGKILLITVLLLLAAAHPLFGAPLAGLDSPTQPFAQEGADVVGKDEAPLLASAEDERIACFERVWSAYREDVWFYGDKGQLIVPAMDFEWLVIRLAEKEDQATGTSPGVYKGSDSQDNDLPAPSFAPFNAHYGEYFSHFLHDPAVAPAMAAYRLRPNIPEEAFRSLMSRLQKDRQVSYVHPAWKIADRLYAPLEKIEIVWKTAADMGQRKRLLDAVGAIVPDDRVASNPQQIAIDPCRQSVWQSANLLAEDILVEQSRPLLMVLEPPVSARFKLAMNGASPGTPIPFTFEIRFSDRVKIETSTIANLSIKPAGIFHNLYDIHYDTPLSSIDLNRSPIRITGQIKIYATGEYSLPGPPVYYSDRKEPESRMRQIKTAGEPIRIAAMLPATGTGFELQVADFDNLAPPASATASVASLSSLLLIVGGLTLTGLCIAAKSMLKKKNRQRESRTENQPLHRSRVQVAGAVSSLQKQRGTAELANLGVNLKNYLSEFSGLEEDRRGGSQASFLRRINPALPATHRSTVAELLHLIEHLLARGEQSAIPEGLAGQVDRLVEDLQNMAEPCQGTAENP